MDSSLFQLKPLPPREKRLPLEKSTLMMSQLLQYASLQMRGGGEPQSIKTQQTQKRLKEGQQPWKHQA